jgi:hypothetical protein
MNKLKIDEITISLHCGSNQNVVDSQIKAHESLSDKIKINWNNRIDRYPKAYPSYSQLMNHAIASSNTEWMIFVNDRTTCTAEQTLKIINLMENGFTCVFLYNVGYMGFSKELIRTIGWWDERYLLGGWEDRDWVYRLAHSNLSLYESQEAHYDYTWKSPLQQIGHNCRLSQPHWESKWNQKYSDAIIKMIPEEKYEHWDLFLGENKQEIKNSWKTWKDSVLGIGFDKPNSGPPGSSFIRNRNFYNLEEVKNKTK